MQRALASIWTSLGLLVAAAGCSKPATGPTAPAAPGVVAAAPSGALKDGPPLVTPGEHMQYKLSLRGIDLATYALAAGELSEIEGKKAIVIQGHAKISGLASFIATIDDRFTSWVDVQTGHSLRFQTDEYASGSNTDIEHAIVELGARTGDELTIRHHMNDGPVGTETQKTSQPVAWDFNAFLLALRAWEGPTGSALSLEVFRSRYMWHVDVAIKGKEHLVTALGELPALRIEGTTYKLTRKGERAPSSAQREFTMWISDDDGRVPLKIEATTDYGALKMEIIDYQAGSGPRLRP